MKKNISRISVATMVLLAAGSVVWGQSVPLKFGGPFGDSSVPSYGKTHQLSMTVDSWSTDFQYGSVEDMTADVWAIAGCERVVDDTVFEPNSVGLVSAWWEPGFLQVGRAYWYYAEIIYCFSTQDYFDGGTITLQKNRDAENLFIRTTTQQPQLHSIDLVDPVHELGLQEYSVFDETAGPTAEWGDPMQVSIPSGVKRFYLIVGKEQISGKDWFTSITVDPNMLADTSQPTPVVLWQCNNKLLKYELSRSVANPWGSSGNVLFSTSVAADPDDSAEFPDAAGVSEMTGIVSAGAGFDMSTFALRVNFGYDSPRFSATTWQPSGSEWDNALELFQAVADVCAAAGIRVVYIDVEPYAASISGGNINQYLFHRGNGLDPDELNWAYTRGQQIAQIFQITAPTTSLMLMPEYGCGSYWFSGSVGGWESFNRFRNGLMSVTGPALNVWVGLGGTRGNDGTANDNTMELRVNGVEQQFSDPAAVKAQILSYIGSCMDDLRDSSDDPTAWDNYGEVAPSFSVLGTAFTNAGKRSAWYTPELFAAQLEAFIEAEVPLIWEWTVSFPWAMWTPNETAAAGLYPYRESGNDPAKDFPDNWYTQLVTHRWLDAYTAVLAERGMPDPRPWPFAQVADVDGDGYVDITDAAGVGAEWSDSSAVNGP